LLPPGANPTYSCRPRALGLPVFILVPVPREERDNPQRLVLRHRTFVWALGAGRPVRPKLRRLVQLLEPPRVLRWQLLPELVHDESARGGDDTSVRRYHGGLLEHGSRPSRHVHGPQDDHVPEHEDLGVEVPGAVDLYASVDEVEELRGVRLPCLDGMLARV